MEKMIKFQLPVESASSGNTPKPVNLDFEESNAVRYCAGYILRTVQKKINKSAHPLKKAIQLCIKDLLESRLIKYMHIPRFIHFLYQQMKLYLKSIQKVNMNHHNGLKQ